MKKNTLILILLCITNFVFGQSPFTVTNSVIPSTFEETTSITITINGNSFNEATAGIIGNALYLWSWSFDINDATILDCPSNGTWTNSNEANRLTYNAGSDTYTITFTPNVFYNRPGGAPIGRLGFLVKAKDGTGDKKSQDTLVEVGLFQLNLTNPVVNSSTIIASGGNLSIAANNTNGNANYNLYANGTLLNSVSNVASYTYNHTVINANQAYELIVTQGATTQTKKFSVIVNPNTISQTIPVGLQDGINYNIADPTKATLVLDAPGKDFIYVAGSFNNWQPDASYAMKKDATPGSTKFWLELTGLVSGVNNTYQYWVVDETPVTNSPKLVKTADSYSTLVLSPFDDPFISATTYPSLPLYPAGQEREVTVLQTGQVPYVWNNTSFSKPKKEDLIVYEVLVRDFDANRNFQSLIDRISYFKNLKVNAIQLMPIMEFEGNESWGYNTAFHLALDKNYGTSNKFKEFVDLCHSNGIAVILDVALNHAFGRNPMNRMWMNDPDGDGWGEPSSDSPYFNVIATHSYSVGNDFNHQQPRTKNYVKRVIKQWIQEYKIDGFRWDLTKGFTQNATGSDANTNAYQADRVAVLKEYADYSWLQDPTHYTIFEHLGQDNEELEWANYRLTGDADGISKGVMMWSEMTYSYSQLLGGYATGADIGRIGHTAHTGFTGKRVMGYTESHDKERLMYTAMTSGNGGGTAPVFGNLNNALNRMSAIGAASLLVPGPKMIWHFADLGMGDSIYTCSNGSINTETDPTPGNCKLDTKPQPQWVNNWLGNANRNKIYNDWSKMITLKVSEPVFEGDYSISPDANNVKQRIYIYDNALPATSLKNVVVLCNFSVADISIVPGFPYAGTWYNLMDNTPLVITSATLNTPIAIPSGQFKIYGNAIAPSLAVNEFDLAKTISLYPNPTNDAFVLSNNTSQVAIYNIAGQVVKTFTGSFESNHVYSVDDLQTGIYLVKITDENNRLVTTKLIKE
jgi:glycosidase